MNGTKIVLVMPFFSHFLLWIDIHTYIYIYFVVWFFKIVAIHIHYITIHIHIPSVFMEWKKLNFDEKKCSKSASVCHTCSRDENTVDVDETQFE